MRLSTTTLLALPLLGAAAEEAGGAFAQYRAQFQNIIGSVTSYLQTTAAAVADAAASSATAGVKGGSAVVETRPTEFLELDSWQKTLYSRVPPDATTPTEWWLLTTGRNKTCFGHCNGIEKAFNETAPRLSSIPKGPNTAILNCEDQPVLCQSWAASPGYLYVIDLLPKPAKTDVYFKRLNLTRTTSESIFELYESHSKEEFQLQDGYFHPFDGLLAQNGLAVPVGYIIWGLNAVPNWAMMIFVSFASRTFMGRRLQPGRPGGPGPATAPAGSAAR